jgi:DNA invertase Pin-like site-specific DNA recombinase
MFRAMTKTILYTRTSHADQNIASQLKQAEAAGFIIDEVVADEGVSGISVPLKERPEGRRLFDLLRRGDVCVVRWLDRLGRNYEDVSASVRELMDRGVVIKTVINGMTFDGAATDPMTKAVRDALLAFMAATAQAQAEATRQAQAAGIALAKEKNKFLGRKPSFSRAQFDVIRTGLLDGKGAGQIAKELGLNRHVVIRIARNVEQADATLAAWGA